MENLTYSIITVIAWGLWAFLPKIATKYISPPSALIYEVMAGMLMAVIALRKLRPEMSVTKIGSIYSLINGVIGYVGVLFYIYAISGQDAIVVAPLSATFPIMTLTLGIIFLKERFSLVNYVGIFLAMCAIYLVLS
ncbi:MAG: EamA family transporter [Proteobacteria bacterium]|nr:EamA family transporter [Pseudomonadota bacterium]